ncbi:uncharacterized protein LOC123514185 isoform X2 [Portunus trituberculatus]|uniref:uncharacterized protein LOC123514185 isoform X2 n=1 Tax=Portunus trituberculatus TaxID=210409 RepID=UPI001E1D08FD|nr:uncharacterized protein LOC123514185 isoform X2 [Portunus trituberculatus]
MVGVKMGERKLIQKRCLAVQLFKKEVTISSPASCDSSSGDTATPVNDPSTATPASTNHQDGLHLFRVWQAANVACTWDKELVEAARAVQYLGHLVGGIVLVGGPASALATISLAWSRSLLAAPPGYSLNMLGEVHGWNVAVVPQGQFTPLADALCWVVHHLTREGCKAGAEAVREALESSFPTMMSPSPSHVHATLSSLIQQCKVYYTGATYGIVQPGTYLPSITPGDEAPVLAKEGFVSVAAQTDLAELITGAAHASDTVIIPTLSDELSGRKLKGTLDTMHLSHHQLHRIHHYSSGRAASLRLSPTRVSLLASHYAAAAAITAVHTYQAQDFSDISIRGERGSVFSKLLRVPGRRRIVSFAAQFPPPEWSDSHAPVVHLHSVAVQTSNQGEVKAWHVSASQWTPRSATLPRRLRRPHSSTPPLPESQHSSPIPRGFTSLLHVHTSPQLGASRSHSRTERRCRTQRYQSPVHQRSESRSCHSSSSEDIADHRHVLPPVIQNFNSKGNQSDNIGHRNKDSAVVSTNMVSKVSYKHQSLDPSKSEERLLEVLQDCHVTGDKNETPVGRQQSSRQKHERVGHRCPTSHPAHNKHAKSKKHKPPDGKFEKNQQAGNSKPSVENHVHVGTEGDSTPNGKKTSKKTGEPPQTENGKEKHQYQRSSLHLDLTSDHMNNCRKVIASPQRPHGLTTNVLHQTPDIQHITKGSTPDLTSRNMRYQDVEKCHKKMCSQTLDQVQRPETYVVHGGKQVTSPGSTEEGEVGHDKKSVSTYPSLSELNLTFSSLAAQKILSGASVNSLDTLAEVNLAALKRNTNTVASALTNTDLGFV